jgi:hypothetical protein
MLYAIAPLPRGRSTKAPQQASMVDSFAEKSGDFFLWIPPFTAIMKLVITG